MRRTGNGTYNLAGRPPWGISLSWVIRLHFLFPLSSSFLQSSSNPKMIQMWFIFRLAGNVSRKVFCSAEISPLTGNNRKSPRGSTLSNPFMAVHCRLTVQRP